MNKTLTIFGGNSNPQLARDVASYVGTPVANARVERFSDGEIFVEVGENVRNVNCFILQSTCYPPNRNLMELLIMIDALKRASAGSIVAIMPYFGYARQDRKVKPRTPISAKLVADLLTAAGATRVLAVDLHAGQIQGFFNIPCGQPVRDACAPDREAIKERHQGFRSDITVVISPDAGGVERARAIYAKAARLQPSPSSTSAARRRTSAEVMNIIGDVKDKQLRSSSTTSIDTAGTLTERRDRALKDAGSDRIVYSAAITHPDASPGPAVEADPGTRRSRSVCRDGLDPARKNSTRSSARRSWRS